MRERREKTSDAAHSSCDLKNDFPRAHKRFDLLNPKLKWFAFVSQCIIVPSLVEIHSVIHKLLCKERFSIEGHMTMDI